MHWLLLLSVMSPSAFEGQGTTWHVDDDAANGGSGLTWNAAFRYVQDALAVAASGDEIRVAGGVYSPDQGTGLVPGNRSLSFELENGVTLRGGYRGPGVGDPNERDIELYTSELTGDLARDDQPGFLARSDNSVHVLKAVGLGSVPALDGFLVVGGNANVSGTFGNGGGAFLIDDASPTILSCTFSDNRADGFAGAVYLDRGAPHFEDCRFEGNDSAQGGACGITLGIPLFERCQFLSNNANTGGALRLSAGTLTLRSSSLEANTGLDGGAIYAGNTATLVLEECTLTENLARQGGAILGGIMTLEDCVFDGNEATRPSSSGQDGGAVQTSSDAIVRNCLFTDNVAGGMGGALNAGGELLLVSSTFLGNTAQGRGGALAGVWVHPVRLIGCRFGGNRSFDKGGGASFVRCDEITNCLFHDNMSNSDGGGAILGANNSLTGTPIVHCTFRNNVSLGRGGAAFFPLHSDGFPRVIVQNSIAWENLDSLGNGETSQFAVSTPPILYQVHYSDIQGWTGSWGGAGCFDANPMFVSPLGPDLVAGTGDDDLSLLATSPAIDAGNTAFLPADVADLDGDADLAEPLPRDLAGRLRARNDWRVLDTGVGNPPVDLGCFEHLGSPALPSSPPTRSVQR